MTTESDPVARWGYYLKQRAALGWDYYEPARDRAVSRYKYMTNDARRERDRLRQQRRRARRRAEQEGKQT